MAADPVSVPAPQEGVLTDARRLSEERYERLLAEHGRAVRRVAASYESNPARREDLVQEIALALWQALPRFRGDCSERTFVFRIAHNRSLTHVWRRKASTGTALDEVEVEDPRAGPEAQAEGHERRARLQATIRSLPLLHRQALTLQLEDLTQAEMARVLGISENAVAVRLSRARKALREALGVAP